jgi:hypothetical protein
MSHDIEEIDEEALKRCQNLDSGKVLNFDSYFSSFLVIVIFTIDISSSFLIGF